jgi:aminoglycoside phosphotransferase (APT) family kinase protein
MLGEGRQADIFEWGNGFDRPPKILKLFKEGRSRDSVERELEFSRAASEAKIPTPRVYGGVVERDGRIGIVYERIEGPTQPQLILSLLFRIRSYSRTLANLHFKAHGAKISGLQTEKEHLKNKIEGARTITKDEKSRLMELTDSMPDGDRLCHNDFHPLNVIFRTPEEGGPVIIDWENAGVGDPLADVALTRCISMFSWRILPNRPSRWIARWLLVRFYRFYSERYFELSGADATGVDRWMTVMAAARIDDDIPEEHEHLVRYVRDRLGCGR